ncbi:molybdenum cofactor synthesis domain-containing protein [Methylobacterium sp. OAE515]
MAQLSDDCFAFGGPLMTIEDAHALFGERLVAVVGTENVPVLEADGRILAEDCVTPIDVPPFPNSAVDGYAVRFADLRASDATILPVGAVVVAGGSSEGVSVAGSAARIFTGAPMPAEADTVFMQEDVHVLPDGRVSLPLGLKRGANSRDAGEDAAKGSSIIPAGRRLRPQDLALATAVGLRTLKVRRTLRVGVFSTGNELVEPGAPLRPGAIYDSNRILLLALLRRMGVAARDLGVIRDDPAALAARLSAAAAEHDVILTSGGVSTGDEDHVKTAVETVGAPRVLEAGDQAGTAGRDGHDRRQAVPGPAGQPGGCLRHPGVRRAAAPRPARRRGLRAAARIHRQGGFLLSEARGPQGVRQGQPRSGRRRHLGSPEVPARRRGHAVIAHRYRRPRGAGGGPDRGRAGRRRAVPSARSPLVAKPYSEPRQTQTALEHCRARASVISILLYRL